MSLIIMFFKVSAKVARKLGCWSWLRSLYLPFFHERLSLDSKEMLMEKLDKFTPPILHQYGSSICHNEIRGGYDLQVIIPAYKVEQYIEGCVDSVLSQNTHYRIFLTIVNDGSPDRTREILRKYENTQNVEIIDQENRGFSGARNAALKVIKASYVTFLDSDDQMQPGSIDALLDKAIATDADIVEGGHVLFSDKGREEKVMRKQEYMGGKWLGVLFGYPWGKVYRASIFANLQFPEGYWFEDTLCSFLIYPQCKRIVTIPDVVYRYRLNPNGITSTSVGNPKVLDSLLITIQLLEEARTLNLQFDTQLYDMFLVQVRNNYARVSTLHNSELDKLVFHISCNLKRDYFDNSHTLNPNLKLIEQSMNEVDYLHYCLVVR